MSEKTKILIAEHDKADIELTREALRKSGISYISEVVDTEVGYNRALKEFVPDIILSDYTFPSFSGPAAFQIREKAAPLTPFIFVSGTIGEERSIELIKNGVTDFVLKENLFSLSTKVNRALKDSKESKEKNKAVGKLQQTLSELGKIMDSAVDIICSIDEVGNFVKINNAAKEIWGYSPEELTGRPFIDFVCAEDHVKTIQAASDTMSGVVTKNFENRYRRKDGTLVPVSWSARWDDEDKLMYCIAKNATVKKEEEEVLEIERQRFYDLFLKAPTSIGVLKGPDHVFEMANSMYMALIGRHDIIGKSVKQILPELEPQGFMDMLDAVYRTGTPFESNEFLVKLNQHGNGKLVAAYLNLVCQAYRNRKGAIEGIFFFAENVTEQVLSRKKTEESEKRFRQIVETAQEGIWLIDENDYTSFVNKKMSDIIGYGTEELVGKKIYQFMDEASSRDALIQIEKRKKGISEIHDSVFITKNHHSVWTSVSANPVFDETGQYKGALSMISDITEKRKTAQQMVWLINNTEESFILMDRELNVISFNEKAQSTYLQFFQKKLAVGKNILMYVPDNKIEIAREIYTRVLEGNEEAVEITTPQPNGEIKNFRLKYKPAKNEHGQIIGAFLSVIDITDKRRAETLKEFERRDKEALINSTKDLIWSVSSDFRLIAANRAFIVHLKNTTGIDLKQGDDLLVRGKYPEEFLSYWQETYALALTGERLVREIYVSTFEQQPESWRETTFNPIYDGNIITGIACYSRDITASKNFENKLVLINKKLETAQQIASLGYWEHNMNSDLLYWSNEIYHIWGVSPETHQLSFHFFENSIHPEDKQFFYAAMKSLTAHGGKMDVEYRIILRSGIVKYIHQQGELVYNENREAVRVEGTVQDITRRKQTEEEMKQLSYRLQLASNSAGLGIWDWNIQKDDLQWDESMYKLYNINGQFGSVYEGWLSRLHPQDQVRVNEDIQLAITGLKDYMTEFRIVWDDQSVHHIKATGMIERDRHGTAIRMIGTNCDITEQKEKQQHLKLLESVITNTTDAVLITEAEPFDEPGPKIVFVNQAFTSMTGYSSAEVLGKTPRILQGVRSDRKELERMSQAMRQWQPCAITLVNYKKNGQEFWINCSISPVANENGYFTHWIGVERDVTELKQSELSLKKLNQDLRQQAKELAISNADLEQFAYVASHDLQEPLRMITSFLSLLEKKYGEQIDEKSKKYIEFAVDGAKRMRHIILDLLEFSRVGRAGEQEEKIDLNEVVREIQVLFRKKVEEQKAIITFDELPEIYAAAAPMRQVFQNLVSNALKYSRGDVPTEIHIGARELQHQWEFSVRDNGIGIEQEYFDRIFVIFQRLHNKDEFSGTGIGLSITKKIIENQGGKIWVESQVGKGSTFYFTLLATSA